MPGAMLMRRIRRLATIRRRPHHHAPRMRNAGENVVGDVTAWELLQGGLMQRIARV